MADRDPQPFTADPAGYENDVYAWAKAQVELLKSGRFSQLDLENVIEEIDSLGNEQAHSIESHMMCLIEHFLKLAISSDVNPRAGWKSTVVNQRTQIDLRLEKSPSLRRQLPQFFDNAWVRARRRAVAGLRDAEQKLVPVELPFTVEQALDWDFFPGA